MGEEIAHVRFDAHDLQDFRARLGEETHLLRHWFEHGRLADEAGCIGLELEAWLIDRDGRPAPCNEAVLARLPDCPIVPELARYNLEFNVRPQPLAGDGLARLDAELQAHWRRVTEVAAAWSVTPLAIGTLPSLRPEDLHEGVMSPSNRYRALNERILAARRGRPLRVEIVGREHLLLEHRDVMLEAAATSFQLHLQIAPHQAVDRYNTAQAIAGPVLAAAVNSPFLFGRDLWAESRIPLFEQAVEAGGYGDAAFGPVRRVTFGSGYLRAGLWELFEENRDHYPVLLPERLGCERRRLCHLRLHNGTIWRWNRPLVGFDEAGRPHLRLEHRGLPAGPSFVDQQANAALFYGLLEAAGEARVWTRLPFAQARDNFYQAARLGLEAHLEWPGLGRRRADRLLIALLPQVRAGLARLGVDADLAEAALAVLRERLETGRTGARWQRDFVRQYGRDWNALVCAYRERQASGAPVHRWPL